MAEVKIPRDPKFCSRTSLIQIGYGLLVTMTEISIGLAFGFAAVAMPQMVNDHSIMHIDFEEASWIASIIYLTSPIGCLISGIIMDRFGRRPALILCQIPVISGWVYMGFAKRSFDVILGRAVIGTGIGMCIAPPRVYITEITLPNMRGLVGSFPNLAMSIGITIQATLGSYLRWPVLCYISACYSLCIVFIYFFLPESPYYLLTKDAVSKAETELRKIRGKNHNIEEEMNDLIEFKTVNNIRKQTLREKFQALFKQSSCIPFWIILVYVINGQFAGISIMYQWAVDILKDSKTSVDPNLGNVIMSVARFLAGIVNAILMYRLGRKTLAFISAFGVGVSCFAIALFLTYAQSPHIFPQICYVAYMVSGTLGYYGLPFLIMSELYPLQVRGTLGGITVSITCLIIFLANKLHPFVYNAIGIRNVIIIFCVSSFICCIFVYFYLPETKNLTLQEIEEFYNKRRPTLVSQREVMSMQMQSLGILPDTSKTNK